MTILEMNRKTYSAGTWAVSVYPSVVLHCKRCGVEFSPNMGGRGYPRGWANCPRGCSATWTAKLVHPGEKVQ
jgi:hypothetical protein